MKKYILIWFVLFGVAFLNGAIRELTYGRYLEEYTRHVVGTIVGVILLGASIYIVNLIWPFQSRMQAFYVGVIWVLMTVVGETLMILFLMKKDFHTVIQQYDIASGRLWPLVLLFILLFPPLIVKD
jgi:hypothetical protein